MSQLAGFAACDTLEMSADELRSVVDLSCDLGEATKPEQVRVELEIWPLITAANVACGGHVGDEDSMREAVERAREHNVILGAHPSYPDALHFGRRSMVIELKELRESLLSQISSLRDIASRAGVVLKHVKPHGALYNDAHHDLGIAKVVVEAVRTLDNSLAVVVSPHSVLFTAALEGGVEAIGEAFADRRYMSDGSLVPRSDDDALLLDVSDAAEQALTLARTRQVSARGGAIVNIPFRTICVHGDMPGSVTRLQEIRSRLQEQGIRISSNARGGES